jgi:DNA (cytosine-5)-methyltransferase 1
LSEARRFRTLVEVSTQRARSRPGPATARPRALDFFAGSGLATAGLSASFEVVWANDVSPKKAAIYRANHAGHEFHLGSIEDVRGADLPAADLSWSSFPCQDLSLAGAQQGLASGRSGLVWQWLRVLDEMKRKPAVVVLENVVGLVSAAGGANYRALHAALAQRGYRVGALLLDAVRWLPQSRPRIFVVGVRAKLQASEFEAAGPTWCHPAPVRRAAEGCEDFVWWRVPEPKAIRASLTELIDFDAPTDEPVRARHNLALLAPSHRERLQKSLNGRRAVFPGYKRTRNGRQVLELRFDDIAGCLRTPEGGSSRQLLVIRRGGETTTRLLTLREAARLMGAGDDYVLVGSYNDGYKALGDAVAAPAVRHLADTLLAPLVERARK